MEDNRSIIFEKSGSEEGGSGNEEESVQQVHLAEKKKLYKHKFQDKWLQMYPWLKFDKNKLLCNSCNKSLRCKIYDIRRHEETAASVLKTDAVLKKHQEVKKAQLKICAFLHEHNLPFLLADHLPKFIKSICPDSDIAKNINCSRTKATYLTNECINLEQLGNISNVKKNKFSLLIDETTDISTEKSLAMVVRFYDDHNKKVSDNFFGLLKLTDSTAESIFSAVIDHFKKLDIPIENLVGFAADNAAVMQGNRIGVQARFKEILPNIYTLDCVCHSVHLCASAAARILPSQIEDFIRDVYHYFSNSSKRIDQFNECQIFCKLKPHKLLHPAQTRWLSLQAAVDRVLENWDPLILFFIN